MRLSEFWRLCLASVVACSLLNGRVSSADEHDEPIKVSISSDSEIETEFAVDSDQDVEETDFELSNWLQDA
ncbi:MAG: hypothetical protein H8E66_08905 [Planctomycetes bacterium]|nr:hypothetical protein [Planctomycetota bacterium]